MNEQPNPSTAQEPARQVDPLVGPFAADQTAQWRRRAAILTALHEMTDSDWQRLTADVWYRVMEELKTQPN